jgi:predicted RNA methylase
MQNTTHAVMAQRHEPSDSLDDFPTPPWATRALVEHVLGANRVQGLTCVEPACGRGHMARALGEYFGSVAASDAHEYGFGAISDFLGQPFEPLSFDWVITNPPFRLAGEFVKPPSLSLELASPTWPGQSSWRASAATAASFATSRLQS